MNWYIWDTKWKLSGYADKNSFHPIDCKFDTFLYSHTFYV